MELVPKAFGSGNSERERERESLGAAIFMFLLLKTSPTSQPDLAAVRGHFVQTTIFHFKVTSNVCSLPVTSVEQF